MNNLFKRGITGSILVLGIIGVLHLGFRVFTLFTLLLGVLLSAEFIDLTSASNQDKKPSKRMVNLAFLLLSACCIGFTSLHIMGHSYPWLPLLLLALFLCCFALHVTLYKGGSLDYLGYHFVGLIYITLPLCLSLMLSRHELGAYKAQNILGIFVLLWVFDSSAYGLGSIFGKHALSPKISPKKTIEGFGLATVVTLSIGYLIPFVFLQSSWSSIDWAVIAGIAAVFGTIGDLFASSTKREAGVKDSGKILPGHGGLLDRFDSYLMTLPWVYLYLEFTALI